MLKNTHTYRVGYKIKGETGLKKISVGEIR